VALRLTCRVPDSPWTRRPSAAERRKAEAREELGDANRKAGAVRAGTSRESLEPPLWEQWAQQGQTFAPEGEKLQKVLARLGVGSRRVCEDMIVSGRITVNGQVADLGRRVDESVDRVEVDGVWVGARPGLAYVLMNKPAGVVTTAHDPQGRQTVIDMIDSPNRMFPVGRLDIDTEGLLVITNDGELTHRLTHPSFGVDKEYVVTVRAEVARADVQRLRRGIELDDGMTAPAEVTLLSPSVMRIIIHEGRNRQVRRMCEAIGHRVEHLMRTRFGPLRDPYLKLGEFRDLTYEEVQALERAAMGVD
jgi:23S rRNA pseudouridine2605 synthase